MQPENERQENERRARLSPVRMPPDSLFYDRFVPGLLLLLLLALLAIIAIIIVGQLGLFPAD